MNLGSDTLPLSLPFLLFGYLICFLRFLYLFLINDRERTCFAAETCLSFYRSLIDISSGISINPYRKRSIRIALPTFFHLNKFIVIDNAGNSAFISG